MSLTYFAVILAVALIGGSSAQYGRVRVAPAPAYAPAYTQPAYPPCGCEDVSALVQLANLLGTPNPPQPKCACGTLNSGNIIDKLIDALILTATANKNKQSQPSGSLIDINLLKGLLSQQQSSPAPTPAALPTTPASSSTAAAGSAGAAGVPLAAVTGLLEGIL